MLRRDIDPGDRRGRNYLRVRELHGDFVQLCPVFTAALKNRAARFNCWPDRFKPCDTVGENPTLIGFFSWLTG